MHLAYYTYVPLMFYIYLFYAYECLPAFMYCSMCMSGARDSEKRPQIC